MVNFKLNGEYAGWYKLSQAELNDIGVKDAKERDGYYVNYNLDDPNKEIDVAYSKGVENDGEIYYRLSDILKYSES